MNKLNTVLNDYNNKIDRLKEMKAKYELAKSNIIAKLDEFFDNDYEAFTCDALHQMLDWRLHKYERLFENESQFNEREYPILEDQSIFENLNKPSNIEVEKALYTKKDVLEVAKENLGLIEHRYDEDPYKELNRVRIAESEYKKILNEALTIIENNPDEKLANIMIDGKMIISLVVYCSYPKKALVRHGNAKYAFVVDEIKLKDYLSQYKMTYNEIDQEVSIASKDLDELIALAREENQEEQTNNDEVTLSL